jgi:hypothetical protein
MSRFQIMFFVHKIFWLLQNQGMGGTITKCLLKLLKFGLSEKHTKFEKIFLIVWMFTQ